MKIILGVSALLIGILGLALPILPGWLLIFAGLALLKSDKMIQQEF